MSGNSLWWRVSGRNRRCITANLHMPEGQQIVKQLSSHVGAWGMPRARAGWELRALSA